MALGHMHSLDFMYCNLMPEHVVLALDGHVMLCDLSMAHRMPGRNGAAPPPARTMSIDGVVPEYVSPEMLLGLDCCKTVDWWSLGCLVCELLTGLTPFVRQDSVGSLLASIVLADVEHLQEHENVGVVEFDLLRQLLALKPEQRLGAWPHGYRGVLAHPWLAVAELAEDALLRKLVTPPYAAFAAIDRSAVSEEVVAAHAIGAEAAVPWADVNVLVNHDQPFEHWSTATGVRIALSSAFPAAATPPLASASTAATLPTSRLHELPVPADA